MCDRDFSTDQLFNEHNQTHAVCGIDGCTFTAHPKLIEKHISMQHQTGLYHKIKNLSTPEEITKWIDERKRKYPTKSHIEIKKAKIKEQKERGEVIKKLKPSRKSYQTKHTSKNRKARKKSHFTQEKKNNVEIKDEELYRGIRPFGGIKSLYEENNSSKIEESNSLPQDEEVCTDQIQISDDEEEQLPVTAVVTPPVALPKPSVLSSLVAADYDSDTDDDGPEEIPIKKIKLDETSSTLISDQVEVCKVSEEISEDSNKIKEISRMNSNSTVNESESKTNKRKHKMATKSTVQKPPNENDRREKRNLMLLERLLSRSIVHERNFIFQCIKYIEDNNFFQSVK